MKYALSLYKAWLGPNNKNLTEKTSSQIKGDDNKVTEGF